MEDGIATDEPFVYRLNDNGTGPSLLVKVRNELRLLNKCLTFKTSLVNASTFHTSIFTCFVYTLQQVAVVFVILRITLSIV